MRGFTLIDMLIATSIIGILTSITIPMYTYVQTRVDNSQVFVDTSRITFRIDRYESDWFHLPNDLKEVGMDQLLDPWGHRYVYRREINGTYQVYSRGPDDDSGAAFALNVDQDDGTNEETSETHLRSSAARR